mmetsp:Transcript_5405/g.14586  ORF Transcript_5405/g.14586 Transcript_5405/m.14586 type:complete len:210 (+) Transcript_5405:814-1443(+)
MSQGTPRQHIIEALDAATEDANMPGSMQRDASTFKTAHARMQKHAHLQPPPHQGRTSSAPETLPLCTKNAHSVPPAPRTHFRLNPLHLFCTKDPGILPHASSTCTLHTHPPHAPFTWTLHAHSPHALSTRNLYMYLPQAPSTCILHMRPPNAPSTCTLSHMRRTAGAAGCSHHKPGKAYAQGEGMQGRRKRLCPMPNGATDKKEPRLRS